MNVLKRTYILFVLSIALFLSCGENKTKTKYPTQEDIRTQYEAQRLARINNMKSRNANFYSAYWGETKGIKIKNNVFTQKYNVCGVFHGERKIKGKDVSVIWDETLQTIKIAYKDVSGNKEYVVFQFDGDCYKIVDLSYGTTNNSIFNGKCDQWVLYHEEPCDCSTFQPLCLAFYRLEDLSGVLPDGFWVEGKVCK